MSRLPEVRPHRTVPFLFALCSGLGIVLSFPRYDLFFVAWIALIPFFWAITTLGERDAFVSGLLFGFVFFFGTQYWIYHSINHYGHLSLSLSLLIVSLLCAYEALYMGMFAALVNFVHSRSRIPLVFFVPALWACLEYVRGIVFTGFPWSYIAHSQYTVLPLIQIADITGAYGVSFLVVAVNCAVVDILILKRRRRKIPLFPAIPSYGGALLVLVLVLGALTYGMHRLREKLPDRKIIAAVVQGNIEQDKKWDPSYQSAVLSTYLSLTRSVHAESPDLIIWPETAVPFYFGSDTELSQKLRDFQKENGIPLFFGSVMVRSLTAGKYRLTNSAILLDNDGKVVYTYDKIHLVPFGEYVPLRTVFFFIDKLVQGVGDYIPGRDFKVAHGPFGQFVPAICYELIFPSLIRKFFAAGGEFLVTITNDAWFGNTPGPYQHFSAGVFRAIEARKSVVRAANTGISGLIDSKGRIVRESGLFTQEVLLMEVPKDLKVTFYTRYGDIFIYCCFLIVAITFTNVIFHAKTKFGGTRW
ncbi:MAG: apolipoprotein N-acyltransferase [bacterium]